MPKTLVPCVCKQCGSGFKVPAGTHNAGGGLYCSRQCANSRFKIDPTIRFFENVNKTETCWLWTGNSVRGYGRFAPHSKDVKAHRFSYELHKGPIPPGMFVCHSCDVPLCVNPEHLWIGTAADNSRDREAKGRGYKMPREQMHPAMFTAHPLKTCRGSKNGSAKLTEETVRKIRSEYRPRTKRGDGAPATMAKKYGVHRHTIHRIVANKGWAHD